jgi:hypothetical protein
VNTAAVEPTTVQSAIPSPIQQLSLVTGSIAASPTAAKSLPIPTDAPTLGIAAGSSLTGLSSSQLDSRLQAIAASGASWIRFDFDWSIIQPDNAQTYQWSTYDNIMADSVKYHLKVLAILDYTPAWAHDSNCNGGNKCAPSNPAQFADFATAVDQRYKADGLHYFEVWNEPNNPSFWQPTPNTADYTTLLKQTYIALHAADPLSYVITGGLSPQATTNDSYSPIDFLSGIYSDGAGGYFDGVGDHPYTFPLTPAADADDAWTQMAGTSDSLRSVMVANGDSNKKIWITEFGAPTGGPGPVSTIADPNLAASPYVDDEGLQAKDLSDALSLYRTYNWVGPFFYYTFQDSGTDQSTSENFFGLLRADGSQKPAYDIFLQASQGYKQSD